MCTTVPSTGSGESPIAFSRCRSLAAPESHGGPPFWAPGSEAIVSKLGPSATLPAELVVEDFELEPQPASASASAARRASRGARRTVETVAPRTPQPQESDRRRLGDAARQQGLAGDDQPLDLRR